jgi:lipoate-protein ligase B
VTFHGRGQLVGYPIIDLSCQSRDVHAYVRCLEDALIRTVARLGGVAERLGGQPGVWMGGGKLASVGIGVRRWVTTHGFALNVTTDLAYFDAIVPCGLPDVRMTSLLAEGIYADIHDVGVHVARELAGALGLRCEVSDIHIPGAARLVPVA